MFTRKLHKTGHTSLTFNDIPVQQTAYQKHLGVILDNKLDFQEHIKAILNKTNKSIDTLRKFEINCSNSRELGHANDLSNHILTKVMLSIANLPIILFMKNWNLYNAKL